jgi:hypothetical protein
MTKDRSITVGSSTPWGNADHVEFIAPGIFQVSTPSHGGFYLTEDRRALIPEDWQHASFNKQGLNGWFEEDCDWCMVALTFKEHFPIDTFAHAVSTFNYWIKKKLAPPQSNDPGFVDLDRMYEDQCAEICGR